MSLHRGNTATLRPAHAANPLRRAARAPAPSPRARTPALHVRAADGIWLDNSAKVKCNVPVAVAWELWDDTERIPTWMPWITSVTVLETKPRKVSEWKLSTNQFGQDFSFSWEATNLTPMKFQKIHWKAEKGVPNRGAIRFFKQPDNPNMCAVELTISYQVPQVLVPFGNALTPVVEGILQKDMETFKEYAVKYQQGKLS